MPQDIYGNWLTPSITLAAGTSKAVSSGNLANAIAAATFTPDPNKTAYITGFMVTASGATTGLAVNVTLTGLVGGTLTFAFVFPAGVLTAGLPMVVTFPNPVPGTAAGVAPVLSLPAGGAGNTNASVVLFGFSY